MPQNFFITGLPKTGKTTLLRDIVKELKIRGVKVGGFISPEEKHHGTRTAFYVMDIETGKKALLASMDGDGPKISKYHVNVKSFENIALQSMRKFRSYDVFVIDEIGRMEMTSRKFVQLVDELIDSDMPFIASTHEEYLNKYGIYGESIALNGNNREKAYVEIMRKIGHGPKIKQTEKSVKQQSKKPARTKRILSNATERMRKRKPKARNPDIMTRKETTPRQKPEVKEAIRQIKEEQKPEKKEKKKGFLGKFIELFAGD